MRGIFAFGVANAALILAALTQPVAAGGFYLNERSIKASGRAFAGAATEASDASVMSFNPAAIAALPGTSLAAGGYLIIPNAKISNRGSDIEFGNMPGYPFSGDNDQGFDATPSGYFAIATPVSDTLSVGLSVTAPFGLKNEYDDSFFGRYDSTKSSVMVIDIAPTLAWRVAPGVSVGGSLSVQRAKVTLDNAVPNPFAADFPDQQADGSFETSASDWSIGYSIGLLFEPSDRVRLGASYRAGVKHRMTGDTELELAGMENPLDLAADLKLPDVFSVAVAADISPRLTVMAQINRYNWSRFKEIRMELADGSVLVAPQGSKDTWGGSIGFEYDVSDRWTFRSGVEYDETPTVDGMRSTRLPDADRLWVAIGATFRLTEKMDLDISYAHMFKKTEAINGRTEFSDFSTVINTIGQTQTSSNVLGVGVSTRF